eukprot:COSAG06_NODE_23164_length_701_cov_0.642857_1_plen_98_part_10
MRWDFPREFLDNIPEDVPEAVHQAYPADKPDIAWHECAEMSVSFYDTDGNGELELEEFTAVVRLELGIPKYKLSDDELALLFHLVDKDNSGSIECHEL